MAKRQQNRTRRARKSKKRPEWVHLTTEHLEQARAACGMSKSRWAKRLGISVAAYHAYLAGTNVPPASKQLKMRDRLDAPTALRLMQGEAPQAEPERAIPASCRGLCAIHCGAGSQLAPEVAETLRTFTVALIERGTDAAEIPALVARLRESLS